MMQISVKKGVLNISLIPKYLIKRKLLGQKVLNQNQQYQLNKQYQKVQKSEQIQQQIHQIKQMKSEPKSKSLHNLSLVDNLGKNPHGIGHVQQIVTKPTINYMFPSYDSFDSILDYEVRKIKDTKFNDHSFFNDLATIDSVTIACKQATQRSTISNVENCEKLAIVQNELISLKFEHQLLKITNQNEKSELNRTIESLKKQVEEIRITNKKTIQEQNEKLAQKDKNLKDIEKMKTIDQEQSSKKIRSIAQRVSSAVNGQRKAQNNIKKLNQDGPNISIENALNQIRSKVELLTFKEKSQNFLFERLKICNEITSQKSLSLKYGPLKFEEGQQVSILKGLISKIEQEMSNLKIKSKESPFSELSRFLLQVDNLVGSIVKEWAKSFKSAQQNIVLLTASNLNEVSELKSQIEDLEAKLIQEVQKKESEIKKRKSVQTQLAQTKQMLTQARRQIELLRIQLQQAQMKIQKLEGQITDLKEKHQTKLKQLQKQKLQLKIKTQTTITDFQNKLNQKQIELRKKNKQITEKNKLIQQKEIQIEQLQNKLNKQSQKNKQISQQNVFRRSIIVTKETELQQLTNSNNSFKSQISSLQKQLSTKKIELSQSQLTVKQQTGKISDLEKEVYEVLKPNLDKKQKDLQNAQIQRKKAINQYKYIIENPPRQYLQYFNGHILNISNREMVEWFVINLQQNVKRKIKSTKFLYKFDPKNNQSFHSYIDKNQHIVILVKIWNGQIIAGYSTPAFVPKTNVDFNEGYMFGLRNKKVFKTKKEPTNIQNQTNPRPITYDEYFLIWGNSDIRIKSGITELYSNYATPGCSYQQIGNKNSTIEDLFELPERQTVLADYELFAVDFEQD